MKETAAVLLLALALAPAESQESKKDKPIPTFTDPQQAGPDFAVQGEYEGPDMGAQVVAHGDGRFAVVLYAGGLPGAGFNGKEKVKCSAKTEDGKVLVSGPWSGGISGGKMSVKDAGGASLELKKVERKSPTLGAKPPKGALVLFDGSNTNAWDAGKVVEDNLLDRGAKTKKLFKDFKLHLEFRLPYMPSALGQARGNSGVYILDRYECQILDSFGLEGKDDECGGFYKNAPPKVNMCLPPLSWQTYDIDFQAPRYDATGKKTAHARVTVLHNGVKIHDDFEIGGTTGGGRKEEDAPGPIRLQQHGNPVVFRNIWVVEPK